MSAPAVEAPPFAPFRHAAFSVLWTATVVGNTGGWIRDTASAWTMTEMAPTPVMVAMVQAAATLPVFLLSLPAGALSDILDRRKLMMAIQAGLCCTSIALALLSQLGVLTPAMLLALTLMAGIGNALAGPVWQSVVAELVPRDELRPAVAMNSLGINISRTVGPAVAALVIVLAGVPAAYLCDVASYGVTIAALLWWRRTEVKAQLPERFGGALSSGLRYAAGSLPLRRILLRAILFFVPASCVWALLPLLARVQLGGGPGAYGLMLGAIGLGAVAGAVLMPRLRRRLRPRALAFNAAALLGVTTAGLALAPSLAAACLLLAITGMGWITMLTTLNATTQGVLPDWVRGRGLAVYLTVYFGGMTGGSVIWGRVAEVTSIQGALAIAGAACIGAAGLALRLPLPSVDDDLTPAHAWPAPVLARGAVPAGGPVMILIGYRVCETDHAAFAMAIAQLRGIRLRDGAYRWAVMADVADREAITECFLVGSWEEHLRQHARVSVADEVVHRRLLELHQGPAPRVRHLIPFAG